ncbi:MAG: hypothetical protein JWP09_829 [Candidatus Taylorbacteria bacterium]|nr:hypothetical protein [Candidatus Taylorbacteria bacterium]
MKLNVNIVTLALFFQQLAIISSNAKTKPTAVSQRGTVAVLEFSVEAIESVDFITTTLCSASNGVACSGVQVE